MDKTQTDTLFITGTGRSGTNILKKVLASHSAMASLPFEYRFIIDPGGVIDFYRSFPTMWSPYRADHAIKELERFLLDLASISGDKLRATTIAKDQDPTGLKLTPPPYAGWELNQWIPDYDKRVKEFIQSLVDFDYAGLWPGSQGGTLHNHMYFTAPVSKTDLQPHVAAFVNGCFEAIRTSQNKSIFQEDNTHNLLVASDLLDLTPHGRLLHVVRDPRDVLASLRKKHWAPTELNHLITWYKSVMETWWKERSVCPTDRVMEVRFEALIEHPASTLDDVCKFIGIEQEDPMLEQDLSKHNIGRHKEGFTEGEVQQIESELAPYMQAYGY